MIGSKVYIDTAPFIYYLEKSALYYDVSRSFFIKSKERKSELFTSSVTVEEYCVFPLSKADNQAVENFNLFLDGMNISVEAVDKKIALKAAELRAKYSGFKALDAIHLATAILCNCTAFITNDKQLRQITEIPVYTMDMLTNEL